MSKRAFVVGLNSYTSLPRLHASVADAQAMAMILGHHKDQEKNFDCRVWLDQTDLGEAINRSSLRSALISLFDFTDDILLYFSGHGYIDATGGILCTADGKPNDWGIPMQEVVKLANESRARQILLILDCCHAGFIGTTYATPQNTNPLATLRENMTVLAASRSTEDAMEDDSHGLFTSALLDGLEGGAGDHMGYVSAPALYEYARRRFAAWDQCPVYKTNANSVFVVRECEPLIARLQLRRLPELFPNAHFKLPLDPDYEPEDENGAMRQPVDGAKIEVAQVLKAYRDAGLLKPTNPRSQLYWAARRSETVELTPRGREYWWLISKDKV